MKRYQKICSFILAICVVLTAAHFGSSFCGRASAANKVNFALNIQSETEKEVIVEFCLVSGAFNSLDMGFVTGDNISSCSKIVTSQNYKNFEDKIDGTGDVSTSVTTVKTMKCAMSTTADYDVTGAVFVATFEKASPAPVSADDISANIPTCATIDDKGNATEIGTTFVNNLPKISGKCGLLAYYKYNSNTKELEISGIGRMYDFGALLSVPWAAYTGEIKNITIDSGITYIGDKAFNKCSEITGVVLPSTVTSIGDYAFSYCTKLSNINLNNISTLDSNVFSGCGKLSAITFNSSISKIKVNTFKDCTSLGKVKIDKNVKTIEKDAFKNCSKLVIQCYYATAAYNYATDNSVKYELLDKYIIGDVNADQSINSTDALMILQYAVGDTEPKDLAKITADLNNDKVYNSVDALIVLQIAVGNVKSIDYQR